jgi:hypothetical protein
MRGYRKRREEKMSTDDFKRGYRVVYRPVGGAVQTTIRVIKRYSILEKAEGERKPSKQSAGMHQHGDHN